MLAIKNLKKWYAVRFGLSSLLRPSEHTYIRAVDDVSLDLNRGEIVGLVGESGSGKTTLGEVVVRLQRPTSGMVLLNGTDVSAIRKDRLRRYYRDVQMIFQDPYETLNPRFTTAGTLDEPLKIHFNLSDTDRRERIDSTLRVVGLDPPDMFVDKYPHEMSGGQRQRVAIARAIILNPSFIVADEPTSMLDVSIRASILNLLKSFKQNYGVSILYISHDLSTVSYLCSRLAVMYLGKILEAGSTDKVLQDPVHPYTKALISAIPIADPNVKRERVSVKGDIPDALHIPLGCRFWPRCSKAEEVCRKEEPGLEELQDARTVACHFAV